MYILAKTFFLYPSLENQKFKVNCAWSSKPVKVSILFKQWERLKIFQCKWPLENIFLTFFILLYLDINWDKLSNFSRYELSIYHRFGLSTLGWNVEYGRVNVVWHNVKNIKVYHCPTSAFYAANEVNHVYWITRS